MQIKLFYYLFSKNIKQVCKEIGTGGLHIHIIERVVFMIITIILFIILTFACLYTKKSIFKMINRNYILSLKKKDLS